MNITEENQPIRFLIEEDLGDRGIFRDAFYISQEQRDSLSEQEIRDMAQDRINKHVYDLDNPVVTEVTAEQIEESIHQLDEQRDHLISQLEELTGE